MHHHIQVFVVGIPIHCHNTSQSGGKLLSVFLSESCFGCIEAPDAAMEFQFRAGIKSGEAWPATGCEFQVLTCIGWSSERNIHISFIIEGNRLRHMPMKSMGVIIGKDHFHLTFGNQFPGGEFIPVKDFCRTVVEISVMDPHSSSITTFIVIVAKPLNDIRFSIPGRIAKGRIATFSPGGPKLDINVSIIIYSQMPCRPNTVGNHHSFKTFRKKKSSVVWITTGDFFFRKVLKLWWLPTV